jgi:hypothetical protein
LPTKETLISDKKIDRLYFPTFSRHVLVKVLCLPALDMSLR